MSKMNRRDYLKHMAIGAATIAGSRLDVFAQRPRRKTRRQPSRRREPERRDPERRDPSILNWNITEDRPEPDAFVTAIFGGLMGFTYDPRPPGGEGKVGFHGGHSNSHELVVRIYQLNPNGTCTPHTEQPVIYPSTKKITLQVIPSSTRPVNYYEYHPTEPFNRFGGDAYDFRWLPDLDGADFYPDNYDKHNDHYRRWLHVKNATFYTRMRTNSKFNLVTQDADLSKPNALIKPFGYVARYMAAAIPLPAGGQYVTLQVDSARAIPLSPGAKYQVVFLNECSGCSEPSPADQQSNDERLRNDFHFARKVIKLPSRRVKIALKRVPEEGISPADTDFCPDNIARNTDAAPCMGGGYGGGTGP